VNFVRNDVGDLMLIDKSSFRTAEQKEEQVFLVVDLLAYNQENKNYTIFKKNAEFLLRDGKFLARSGDVVYDKTVCEVSMNGEKFQVKKIRYDKTNVMQPNTIQNLEFITKMSNRNTIQQFYNFIEQDTKF